MQGRTEPIRGPAAQPEPPPAENTGASQLWRGNDPPNILCSVIQLFLEAKITVRNVNEPLAWSGQLAWLACRSRLAGKNNADVSRIMLALAVCSNSQNTLVYGHPEAKVNHFCWGGGVRCWLGSCDHTEEHTFTPPPPLSIKGNHAVRLHSLVRH